MYVKTSGCCAHRCMLAYYFWKLADLSIVTTYRSGLHHQLRRTSPESAKDILIYGLNALGFIYLWSGLKFSWVLYKLGY